MARSSDFVITRMITDRIGLHSVLLPLQVALFFTPYCVFLSANGTQRWHVFKMTCKRSVFWQTGEILYFFKLLDFKMDVLWISNWTRTARLFDFEITQAKLHSTQLVQLSLLIVHYKVNLLLDAYAMFTSITCALMASFSMFLAVSKT